MIRIAIADDHAIVRKGMRQVISEAGDLALVGEASSADELLTLLRSHPADIVVLDMSLGTRSGLDVVKHIRSEFPRLRVVILSMHPAGLFAARALRAGAAGYVQKDDAAEELVTAIRKVAAGGRYVNEELAEQFAAEIVRGGEGSVPHERLSDREFEVFRLLGTGMSVTEIARVLNLSVKTVSTHRTRIIEKTGLPNNAAIVDYVIAHQLR